MKRILISIATLWLIASAGIVSAANVVFTPTVNNVTGDISISMDSSDLSGQSITSVNFSVRYSNPSVSFVDAKFSGSSSASISSSSAGGLTSVNILASVVGASGPHIATLYFKATGSGSFAPLISGLSINYVPALYAPPAPIYYSAPVQRSLIVSVGGFGSVTSVPAFIDCPLMGKCSGNFSDGALVTLMATPAAGTTFTGWGGDCSGKSTCTLTMSSNKSVTATFGTQSVLSVNKIGKGTIVSTPAGINCGATCSAGYSDGTTVSLVATPTNDYSFAGWSGASCFGTGPCLVTMFGAQSVTATFNPPARPTSPSQVAGTAGNQKVLVTWKASQGIVTSYTATSINAAGDAASQKSCSVQTPTTSCEISGLTNGVLYRFTVVATGPGGTSDPSAPSDWSIPATSSLVGQCGTASGIFTNTSPNPLDLCLAGYPNTPSKDSTGRFNWICYGAGGGALINCASGGPLPVYPAPNVTVSLAVSSPSGKSGTVKSDPFGIDCGLRCDYSFTKNQRITLTVTPLPGAVFNGWSGACNNKKLSCSFAPKKNLKVTAKFK